METVISLGRIVPAIVAVGEVVRRCGYVAGWYWGERAWAWTRLRAARRARKPAPPASRERVGADDERKSESQWPELMDSDSQTMHLGCAGCGLIESVVNRAE